MQGAAVVRTEAAAFVSGAIAVAGVVQELVDGDYIGAVAVGADVAAAEASWVACYILVVAAEDSVNVVGAAVAEGAFAVVDGRMSAIAFHLMVPHYMALVPDGGIVVTD